MNQSEKEGRRGRRKKTYDTVAEQRQQHTSHVLLLFKTDEDMIRIKRRSNELCQFSENNIKKLKIATSDHRPSCFESLSNELYFEIFEYLEGFQLHQAFSNLNIRFQNLLSDPSLRLKMELMLCSEDLQNHWTEIITSNRDKIISLNLFYPIFNTDSFLRLTIDSSFSCLQSLMIEYLESNKLIPLLVSLISLPRLLKLRIHAYYEVEEINNIYQIIFNLPMLKYNQISFFPLETSISLPMAITEQFSNIEHLVINHPCALNELISILSYTPRLRRLVCSKVDEWDETVPKTEFIPMSHLTHVSLARCSADFNDMEMFIKKVSSQLEVLRLTCVGDSSYLDADRWERIISKHFTHLRVFDFKYQEDIDGDFEVSPYHSMIARFNSSFWIDRKWFFKLSLSIDDWFDDILIYAICPFRETNSSLASNQEINNGLVTVTGRNVIQNGGSFEKRETISYTLNLSERDYRFFAHSFGIDYEDFFFDMIGPILTILPISNLNVTCEEIFIGTLITLCKYLPNLRALIVSSLALVHPRCLSAENVRTLRLVSNNSKITRVNLQWMSDVGQVQFLLDLCPRIEHLEVDCTNGVSPEKFIRFILLKNIKYNPNLSSLCLKISATQEILVDKLKGMIALEQLCQNYNIEQVDNQIHFQWH